MILDNENTLVVRQLQALDSGAYRVAELSASKGNKSVKFLKIEGPQGQTAYLLEGEDIEGRKTLMEKINNILR